MADMTRVEQVKAEALAGQLGKTIADDVIWMARQIGGTLTLEPGIADTRYTRLLREMANQMLSGLEDEMGMTDG